MKQLLLLLLVSLGFSAASNAQSNLVPLLRDSSHYYYYDGSTGALQFSTKYYDIYNNDDLVVTSYSHSSFNGMTTYYKNDYEYNSNQQFIHYTTLKSDVSANGPWSNFLREDYTYDAQGRNNYFLGQFDSGSGWENYYQQTTWFDDAAATDSSLYQLWDAGNSVWNNYRRQFNSYYPNGFQESYISDEWVMNSAAWRNLEEQYYTYLPNDATETHTTISNYSSGNSYVLKDSFVYRADDLLDTTFTTTQLLPNGTPNFIYRKNKYDPDGNLLREDSYLQVISEWQPISRMTFAPADGVYSNDPAYHLAESYDVGGQYFYPLWSIERSYELLGNGTVLYVEVNKQRNPQNQQLVVQSIDSTWYQTNTVGVNAPFVPAQADCNFANPYTPGSPIVCQADDTQSPLTVHLRNTVGQLVLQARVMPGEAWQVNQQLPQGLYTLSVWQKGHYLGVRKMVVR